MPGPYIHISSARTAAHVLRDSGYSPAGTPRIDPSWTGLDPQAVGNIMAAHSNALAIGAVGPDLFFFLPDFRDVTVAGRRIHVASIMLKILHYLENVYGQLDPAISLYEHYLGPIGEDTAEEISRLTGGLSEQVGNIMGEVGNISFHAIELLFAELNDWWAFFSLGLNKGYDDKSYMWSDILHYRRTESFARALLARAVAADDDRLRAYAFGYMTHVATDVTGHAFVNTVSGGPFRSHWQRHHLVENHMDAHWYLHDPTSPRNGTMFADFTQSALHFDIAFHPDTGDPIDRPNQQPTGGTLRETWAWRRMMDVDSDFPDALAQMIADAMHDVYYDGSAPTPRLLPGDGAPTPDEIKEAYTNFFRYIKMLTTDGLKHQPPERPELFPNLDFPTITDPAGDNAPVPTDHSWHHIRTFLLKLLAVILFLKAIAIYLATLPWAIAADLVTYPLRLAMYYAFELPLFHIIKSFRIALVMMSYIAPTPDEISQQLIRIDAGSPNAWGQMLNDMLDVFGGADIDLVETSGGMNEGTSRFADPEFPHLRYAAHPPDELLDLSAEFRHPWDYPTTPAELPLTISGPHASGAPVDVLFRTTATFASIRDQLETAADPEAIHLATSSSDFTPQQHLGDVVSFSNYVIWLLTRDPDQSGTPVPITEWNLDADRGYGYHCWDWNRH